MSRLSIGRAEDLATNVLLASNKDILLIPAMNVRMWLHKATQSNLKILQGFGYLFLGPEKGEMACGEFGEGKMSSPRQIYKYLKNYFNNKNIVKKKNWKAIVTTGPTREYIDPVRYISNESSGKQGCEIAIALKKCGIKTTLIAGPSSLIFPKDLKVKKITSADEMLNEVKKLFINNSVAKMKRKNCDIIFANDVSQKGVGFNSDYNKIFVIDGKDKVKIIPKNKKSFIANKIAEILLDKLLTNDKNIN